MYVISKSVLENQKMFFPRLISLYKYINEQTTQKTDYAAISENSFDFFFDFKTRRAYLNGKQQQQQK